MDKLIYSTNWNHKLGSRFHTRIAFQNGAKHKVGNRVIEYLNSLPINIAIICEVKTMPFSKMSDAMICLDMGMSKLEGLEVCKKMFKNWNPDKDLMDWMILNIVESRPEEIKKITKNQIYEKQQRASYYKNKIQIK